MGYSIEDVIMALQQAERLLTEAEFTGKDNSEQILDNYRFVQIAIHSMICELDPDSAIGN